jgi:hypothetical protein
MRYASPRSIGRLLLTKAIHHSITQEDMSRDNGFAGLHRANRSEAERNGANAKGWPLARTVGDLNFLNKQERREIQI